MREYDKEILNRVQELVNDAFKRGVIVGREQTLGEYDEHYIRATTENIPSEQCRTQPNTYCVRCCRSY